MIYYEPDLVTPTSKHRETYIVKEKEINHINILYKTLFLTRCFFLCIEINFTTNVSKNVQCFYLKISFLFPLLVLLTLRLKYY